MASAPNRNQLAKSLHFLQNHNDDSENSCSTTFDSGFDSKTRMLHSSDSGGDGGGASKSAKVEKKISKMRFFVVYRKFVIIAILVTVTISAAMFMTLALIASNQPDAEKTTEDSRFVVDLPSAPFYDLDCLVGSSTCAWRSSGADEFSTDWKVTDVENNIPLTKIKQRQLVAVPDAALVLKFAVPGKSRDGNYYFRSPLVTARSNCTCVMKIVFLMRGHRVPRLRVAVVYGSNQTDPNRPYEKLWSAPRRHEQVEWIEEDIGINLIQNSIPFQFELQVTEVAKHHGDLLIDDITFHQCGTELREFSFVSDAEGYQPALQNY